MTKAVDVLINGIASRKAVYELYKSELADPDTAEHIEEEIGRRYQRIEKIIGRSLNTVDKFTDTEKLNNVVWKNYAELNPAMWW